MRITLLRSPTQPDPMADYGEHQFQYSFFPHTGSWNEETQREAYLLNDPILVFKSNRENQAATRISGVPSLISTIAPNVIIETIKRAEDGEGIIVRLYESQRKRGPVHVRFGHALDSVWTTNLLEENETDLHIDKDSIQLNLRPYQIVTMRAIFK